MWKTFFKWFFFVLAVYVVFVAAVLNFTDTLKVPAPSDEQVPASEEAATREILAMIQGQLAQEHATEGGIAHRDAHAKHHGCVRAEFEVVSEIPKELRVGLFETPGKYKSWIRYSNGAGNAREDSKPDGRGMAVKVIGVKGEKILAEEKDALTQDFLMINNPAFFVRNATDYIDFQRGHARGLILPFFTPSLNPFHWRAHEARVVGDILQRKTYNPLDLRYWSMTPYKLGSIDVKFSAVPCQAASGKYSSQDAPEFLRDNMAKQLADTEGCFDFMLQLRKDPRKMPVEDSSIEWSEEESPFVRVARITIPKQNFASEKQMSFCENLSYTPWHSLPAHRPVGGINRVRKTVYQGIQKYRHETNKVPMAEPTGDEQFQ